MRKIKPILYILKSNFLISQQCWLNTGLGKFITFHIFRYYLLIKCLHEIFCQNHIPQKPLIHKNHKTRNPLTIYAYICTWRCEKHETHENDTLGWRSRPIPLHKKKAQKKNKSFFFVIFTLTILWWMQLLHIIFFFVWVCWLW